MLYVFGSPYKFWIIFYYFVYVFKSQTVLIKIACFIFW